MRRLSLAVLAVTALLLVTTGSASAVVRSQSVASCLSQQALVSTSRGAPPRGQISPVVRAQFKDGAQVRLWFYATPAAARASRPVGTFRWNATRENVGYVWNHKPTLNQRIALKFCITPPGVMPAANSGVAAAMPNTRGGQASQADTGYFAGSRKAGP